MHTDRDSLIGHVCDRVRGFLRRTDTRELSLFVDRLHEQGFSVVLFGGTVRDLLLQEPPRYPRDIDLVVDGGDIDAILPMLADGLLRRTRFGGLHFRLSEYAIDLWSLPSTWGFSQIAQTPQFSTLPLTTFLNAEAIAVEIGRAASVNRTRVFDSGFLSSVLTRTLEINLSANPYPELCAVRSLRLACKTGFRIGDALADFIRQVLMNASVDSLLEVQRHHYGTISIGALELQRLRTVFLESAGSVSSPFFSPKQFPLPLSGLPH